MRTYGLSIAASCLLALALTGCSGGDANGGTPADEGRPVGSATTSAADAGSNASADDGSTKGGTNGGTTGEAPDGGGKKTIVFSTFWQDAKFEDAIKQYEAQHPNIDIKLEEGTYKNETLEADIDKYLTATNTAMLAGKGPDILAMDLLPTDNYVKHKLLADLGPFMEQDSDFHKGDYFTNILDNVRIGEGLYSMPLTFFLMGFAGDVDAIADSGAKFDDLTWSWSDFEKTAGELVAKGALKSALSYESPEYLLGEMVSDNHDLFIDDAEHKARFDSASFTGLMKQVKALFDDGVVSKMGRGVNAYFQSIQINSPKDYLESMQGYSLGVKLANKNLGEHVKLYAKPHAQDTAAGGYFKTYRSVAINANSKVQPEAWDFIAFLMSEEIQEPLTATGFPINKAAYAKQIQAVKDMGTIKGFPEGPLQGATFKVDEAMLDGLSGYVNGAVHSVGDNKSDKLWQMVVADSKAFFAGQKSAEDVAGLIQNKATTLLNE
ncbi:ABC transporter substrate-binding protein [Paenibacillus sacheonensis]|uniref:Extracellular solute-binding protein n=1 Tax=Paenibacillus sacheonensis TaxID=742054 RepID=A0A7X5C296_9BACL|nr:ABC transporter substrate-binding protein [Paenibacillus sacheonensis]MBM7563651.1 multiple sugar transport system substrate-binding protein [Paenibacillus sacheonensis]NBC71055.1 extracellular solute-binding protein [Paenibacillus sacheonensis]